MSSRFLVLLIIGMVAIMVLPAKLVGLLLTVFWLTWCAFTIKQIVRGQLKMGRGLCQLTCAGVLLASNVHRMFTGDGFPVFSTLALVVLLLLMFTRPPQLPR